VDTELISTFFLIKSTKSTKINQNQLKSTKINQNQPKSTKINQNQLKSTKINQINQILTKWDFIQISRKTRVN
jgi:hypothetical protein